MHGNRRAPRIPPGAGGLLAAWEAERRGDRGPLEDWFLRGLPALRDAIIEAGTDPETADRVASAVPERMLRVVEKGIQVDNELAMLACLCVRTEVDLLRVDLGLRHGEAPPERNGQRPTANGQRPTANGQRHTCALSRGGRRRA